MTTDTATRSRALHERAIVIDGHCDILIPVTEGKMDLRDRAEVPPIDTWLVPPGLDRHPMVQFGLSAHTIYFGCMGQYDLPRWKEGGITAPLCAIYLSDDKLDDPFRRGMEMVRALHHGVRENPDLILATTVADIRRAKKRDQVAAVLTFEGCEALGSDLRLLDLYHALGLRAASLTHTRRNMWADGCWSADRQGGLTSQGKQLVRRLEQRKIVVDLVHILDALAKNGGVLGLIWIAHEDLDSVVRDIETALDVMGPDHIGIGSDHYGVELAPRGLEDISKTPAITQALVARGHSDEVILKFLGENYLRVFEEVWGG